MALAGRTVLASRSRPSTTSDDTARATRGIPGCAGWLPVGSTATAVPTGRAAAVDAPTGSSGTTGLPGPAAWLPGSGRARAAGRSGDPWGLRDTSWHAAELRTARCCTDHPRDRWHCAGVGRRPRTLDGGGGTFIFDFAPFAPTTNITIELAGRTKTHTCLVERAVLARLR